MTEYSTIENPVDIYPYIDRIVENLRELDLKDVRAKTGQRLSVAEAIKICVDTADRVIMGLADGEPAFICGVREPCLSVDFASPWFLACHILPLHRTRFLRECRNYAQEFGKNYKVLGSLVLAENTDSIRWLEWMGFFVNKERPVGIGAEKVEFYQVYWRG